MTTNNSKRYLAIFNLKTQRTPKVLKEIVEQIGGILKRIGNGKFELAFASSDAHTFGYLVKTELPARAILSILESPGKGSVMTNRAMESAPLTNSDGVVVIEIGEDFSGKNLSRAWTWLQRH